MKNKSRNKRAKGRKVRVTMHVGPRLTAKGGEGLRRSKTIERLAPESK